MSGFDLNEDALSGGEYSGSQNETDASQPTESAFPDEDEETITMLDVIEREDKLEEEASAVLGNSDEKNCTYPKGYVSRQALYSCATCFDATKTQAAICLACSLECHDNHDVYELYTKRNYRCDCGNSKFNPDFKCKLEPNKEASNDKNNYNHNFSGKYCICDRRYPPDENDDSSIANDEMLQCIVCEDWYHERHLGIKEVPNRFDELICEQCVDKLDFVHYYKIFDNLEDNDGSSSPKRGSSCCVKSVVGASKRTCTGQEKKSPDVHHFNHLSSQPSCSSSSSSSSSSHSAENHAETTKQVGTTTATTSPRVPKLEGCTSVSEDSRNASETDTSDSLVENKDPSNSANGCHLIESNSSSSCILENLKLEHESKSMSKPKGSIFWNTCNWRANLCRCQKCMVMYEAKGCLFLVDDKDTVQYYEAQGKALAKDKGTPLERGMSALNRMNRAAVVEALHGYDELKADLSSYLRKFADNNKVVREEDIHEFFNQLRSKKRPRLDE